MSYVDQSTLAVAEKNIFFANRALAIAECDETLFLDRRILAEVRLMSS